MYLDQVDGGFRRYEVAPDGTATPTHLIGMNPFAHLATYDSLVLVANGRQGLKILAATGTVGVVTASNENRAFVVPNIISDGRLTVRCDVASIASVSLIDGLGRCAWTIRGAEVHRLAHVYDIRFLPKGRTTCGS